MLMSLVLYRDGGNDLLSCDDCRRVAAVEPELVVPRFERGERGGRAGLSGERNEGNKRKTQHRSRERHVGRRRGENALLADRELLKCEEGGGETECEIEGVR